MKQAGETSSGFSSIDKPDLSWACYPRLHGGVNEGLRASTRTRIPRIQTAEFRSEASKRVQQQTKEAKPKPLIRDAGMQSSKERALARPDNRRHEVAGPGRRIRGQYRHTGRHHCSQESCPALGTKDRGLGRSGSLNVVDRWITLR